MALPKVITAAFFIILLLIVVGQLNAIEKSLYRIELRLSEISRK